MYEHEAHGGSTPFIHGSACYNLHKSVAARRIIWMIRLIAFCKFPVGKEMHAKEWPSHSVRGQFFTEYLLPGRFHEFHIFTRFGFDRPFFPVRCPTYGIFVAYFESKVTSLVITFV